MKTATPHGRAAWSRLASIADYDGTTDKENSSTEGERPYALALYVELRDNLRGSAYTNSPDTLVHTENLALARFFAAMIRGADRVRNNALPGISDGRLEQWCDILGVVSRAGDTGQSKREACAAHYKLAPGPRRQVIDDAVSELLGDLFVAVHRFEGVDLATPPEPTRWPTFAPGDPVDDLGGGAWYSQRCHIQVEVTYPNGMTLADYRYKLDAQLFRLLNRILPAFVTFDWSVRTLDGFLLDIDMLDFAGLGD